MHTASAIRDAAVPAIGNDELAEGLMLVRASTLKIIRFQLAMERRDRRVALEAVDDLVALDGCLQKFLAQVPNGFDDGQFSDVLERERSALNVEKHTLAGGIRSRQSEVETLPPERPAVVAEDFTAMDEWVPYGSDTYELEPTRGRWWRWVAVVLLFVAIACGAFALGRSGTTVDWPQLVNLQ